MLLLALLKLRQTFGIKFGRKQTALGLVYFILSKSLVKYEVRRLKHAMKNIAALAANIFGKTFLSEPSRMLLLGTFIERFVCFLDLVNHDLLFVCCSPFKKRIPTRRIEFSCV